jgi:uncharacterized protein YjdB
MGCAVWVVMLVSFAGFVGACSSSKSPAGLNTPPSDTGTVGPPASIVVAPGSVSLITGQQQQYSDTVKDSAGHVLSGQTVVWGLTNPQVAAITPTGLLTASTVGSDTVEAGVGSLTGKAALSVALGALQRIVVTPAAFNLGDGQTTTLHATGLDAHGDTLSGLNIRWSATNSFASVSPLGVVTGTNPGIDTIQAENAGIVGNAVVTVSTSGPASIKVVPITDTLIVGKTVQLRDTVKDASGNVLSGQTVTWGSDNQNAATVSSTGLVKSVGAGSATITVSDGSVHASATIVVPTPLVPTSIVVNPQTDTLEVGTTVQLSDTVKDQNGHPMTGQTVTWSSSNSAIASVSPNGLVTGDSIGTVTVTATDGTAHGSRTIGILADGTGIDYHGGPVILTPKVAALYWGPSTIYNGGPTPGTFGSPTADQSLIAFLLNNLGGSPLFNILTTYTDAASNPVQNVVTYTQYWADATTPPLSVADTLPSAIAGLNVADSTIAVEILNGFTNGTLTYDPNTMYAVFTGPGVNLGGGFRVGPGGYCGYHNYFTDGLGRTIKYAIMPHDQDFVATTTVAGCDLLDGSPNNDPAADAEVTVLTHELAETVTDEYGNGWYSDSLGSSNGEIGDLCNFKFGTTSASGNGAEANQTIGGKNFLIQMLWVNADSPNGRRVGCQQGWSGTTAVMAQRRPFTPKSFGRAAIVGYRHIMPMYRKSVNVPLATR